MKKYQYIVAVACVLVGAVGFASMYAVDLAQDKKNPSAVENTQGTQEETHMDESDHIAKQEDTEKSSTDESESLEPNVDGSEVADNEPEESESASENASENAEEPVDSVNKETLHFQPERGLVWPVKGSILLDYCMDATIFYPTLQQYQYNPAMVIDAEVNNKVYFIAKGKITNIETNEVTGCTVTQDLGDGYTAKYGQLKELNFEVGDLVESGQIVGYVSEPTKYFAVEGPNVYFQLLKNNVPVDPEEVLPEMSE